MGTAIAILVLLCLCVAILAFVMLRMCLVIEALKEDK